MGNCRRTESTSQTPQFPRPVEAEIQRWAFPLHSPLLRESLSVSFPPLSNMRYMRVVSPELRSRSGVSKRADPGPQSAFEESMINVSCISHYFSQLAAFFIDTRAE
ncbi:Hypp2459 [Branchiostoma lanceolatum]|nr:Hypp2459 [Branchiostoma lanceolatum]